MLNDLGTPIDSQKQSTSNSGTFPLMTCPAATKWEMIECAGVSPLVLPSQCGIQGISDQGTGIAQSSWLLFGDPGTYCGPHETPR